MDEQFNKNAKVELLTKMILRIKEEKALIVKDPLHLLKCKCKNRLGTLQKIGISVTFLFNSAGEMTLYSSQLKRVVVCI